MKGSKTRITRHKSKCKLKFTLKPLLSGSLCSETTVQKVESDGKLNTNNNLLEVLKDDEQSDQQQKS